MTIKTKYVTEAEVALIRTCVHEAGHAVVATVLEQQVHHAAIVGDSHGRTEYAEAVPDLLAGVITFAGPYAEAFWEAAGRPDSRQIAAALAANGRDAAALHALGPGARTAAQAVVAPLVERCWGPIARTAVLLFGPGR